jgi:hypothetical protein
MLKLSQTTTPGPALVGTRLDTPSNVHVSNTAIPTSDTLITSQPAETETARLTRLKSDLAKVVEPAKYGHSQLSVPHHFKILLAMYSPRWLFNSAENQPPRESFERLDALTRKPDGFGPKGSTPESRLTLAILSSKTPLEPAELMALSLKANGNNYFLASLAAHNVLKNATCTERRLHDKRPVPADIATHDQAIIAKLVNLRDPNSPDLKDKMGPWYHMFGMATWDAANQWAVGEHTHGVDELAIKAEHARVFSPGFWKGVSNVLGHIGLGKFGRALVSHEPLTGADAEKGRTDQSAVDAFKLADRMEEKAGG